MTHPSGASRRHPHWLGRMKRAEGGSLTDKSEAASPSPDDDEPSDMQRQADVHEAAMQQAKTAMRNRPYIPKMPQD